MVALAAEEGTVEDVDNSVSSFAGKWACSGILAERISSSIKIYIFLTFGFSSIKFLCTVSIIEIGNEGYSVGKRCRADRHSFINLLCAGEGVASLGRFKKSIHAR